MRLRPLSTNGKTRERKADAMKTRAGLWIDHKKAIVVKITDQGEEVTVTVSGVERQLRRAGDSPLKGSYESQQVPADDRRQTSLTSHLNAYYDAVIAVLGDAESILVFGPGEAKGELRKRLERDHLGARIAAIETADRMTEGQVAAKVRQHFDA
jgi:hypothetical protein